MPRIFLICGLPRSRTAWVANFLTHGRVRCAHELSASVTSPEGLARELQRRAERAVPGTLAIGNADTAQVLWLDNLLERLPEAKLVVIRRPAADVAASLRRCGLPDAGRVAEALSVSLDEAARRPATLVVPYDGLSSEETGRVLLAHVAPEEVFDAERWAMLRDFNVQVTRERLRELTGVS